MVTSAEEEKGKEQGELEQYIIWGDGVAEKGFAETEGTLTET